MILNVIIYTIAGIMYGVEIMIYSIIYCVCESLTIDKMHDQNICSTAFIFCKKNPKKLNKFIKEDLGRDGFLEEAWAWTKEYGGIIQIESKRQ